MQSVTGKYKIFFLLFSFCTGILSDGTAQTVYQLNYKKELYLSGIGFTVGVLGKYLNQELVPLTAEEVNNLSRNEINKFDRPATYQYSEEAARLSDVLVGVSVLLPVTLFTQYKIRQEWETVSIMYLETLMFSNFVPLISKGRVKRVRPYVYNEEVPMEKKLDKNALRSFYSGHTTNAFASAVFLSTVYSRYNPRSNIKPYIWAGSLGLASLVGYLRFQAGNHFPTDILTGAVVGSTIGFLIPYVHQVSNPERISLELPGPMGGMGFHLCIRF